MTTATANRLLPDLGARIWLLVLVNCMANTGSGLILPFLIVYLHNARGTPLDRAGLLLALIGAAGIAATPFAGVLADRIGARLTFATGERLFMVATAAFIPVTSFTQAIAPALASGLAGGSLGAGFTSCSGRACLQRGEVMLSASAMHWRTSASVSALSSADSSSTRHHHTRSFISSWVTPSRICCSPLFSLQ